MNEIIGEFEKRLGQEVKEYLKVALGEEADVMVLQSAPGHVMIQVIYPWGYLDEVRIERQNPTIFRVVEEFCLSKLGVGFWGFVIAKTHMRGWIDKNSQTEARLRALPQSFAT